MTTTDGQRPATDADRRLKDRMKEKTRKRINFTVTQEDLRRHAMTFHDVPTGRFALTEDSAFGSWSVYTYDDRQRIGSVYSLGGGSGYGASLVDGTTVVAHASSVMLGATMIAAWHRAKTTPGSRIASMPSIAGPVELWMPPTSDTGVLVHEATSRVLATIEQLQDPAGHEVWKVHGPQDDKINYISLEDAAAGAGELGVTSAEVEREVTPPPTEESQSGREQLPLCVCSHQAEVHESLVLAPTRLELDGSVTFTGVLGACDECTVCKAYSPVLPVADDDDSDALVSLTGRRLGHHRRTALSSSTLKHVLEDAAKWRHKYPLPQDSPSVNWENIQNSPGYQAEMERIWAKYPELEKGETS